MSESEIVGLSHEEVAQRVAAGQVNVAPDPPGRSLGQIIRANVFTTVNGIMIVLFALILVSGHWKDGLFVGVVFSNSVVGVTQEVRARRELAKLQVLTQPTATVIRNGERQEIDAESVVLGDAVFLAPGAQVPADGEVVQNSGIQLDESMLSGESKPAKKSVGDSVLSGSFVVSGSATITTTAVGADSYASDLTNEAKSFTAAESHLRQAVDRILRWLTILIPIASALLLVSLLRSEDRWQDALQGTVAAAVAMVPDGLVLLTSVAFVAGILELSRRKALAKQLSTVEVLARVDTLCIDKTGTITTGEITFAELHTLNDTDPEQCRCALAAVAASDRAPNATMKAIASGVGSTNDWVPTSSEPFSSARKWSAAQFENRGWYYLGAPDVLLDESDSAFDLLDSLSADGKRTLILASSANGPNEDDAPKDLKALAIVELEDELRPDVKEILAYFADQNVRVKVISGDNHETVSAIAARAGLVNAGRAIDARTLPEENEPLSDALEESDVFGRVKPRQKQAMVNALQSRGHIVAMTGDGVNDILALKAADLGIAMGSGSSATKSVADLVLTNNAFSTLPIVVAEGRKVINNVERVANLFVTKAVYAVLLTLAVGALGSPFPFLPRQLTLIGTFSIGVPGFFLALAPEVQRVRSGFLARVLRFSVPSGVIAGTATLTAYELARRQTDLTLPEARTMATITLLAIGLAVLVVAARPLRTWKVGLALAMAASYALVLAVPALRRYFELDLFGGRAWAIAAVAAVGASTAIALVPWSMQRMAPRDLPE